MVMHITHDDQIIEVRPDGPNHYVVMLNHNMAGCVSWSRSSKKWMAYVGKNDSMEHFYSQYAAVKWVLGHYA